MPNPLLESRETKIKNKPDFQFKHFQISQALRGENRIIPRNSLQLNDNPIFNEDVYALRMLIFFSQDNSLVNNRTRNLPFDIESKLP